MQVFCFTRQCCCNDPGIRPVRIGMPEHLAALRVKVIIYLILAASASRTILRTGQMSPLFSSNPNTSGKLGIK